jgi:FAD synthetase
LKNSKRSGIEFSEAEIKALYLLQLPRGYFTADEYASAKRLGAEQSKLELEALQSSGIIAPSQHYFRLTDSARKKIRVVLAGGVYDVVHLGHVASLSEARTHGDVLVVVVATDVTVENFKGRKPIFPQEDRRAIVESLKPVDRAVLGYEDVGMGYEQILSEVKPDIVALGHDQDMLAKTVQKIIDKRGLNCKIVRLTKYNREKYLSSSAARQRILESSK